MKSGVLKETDGFDILIDGVKRTFYDQYDGALAMARELKARNRASVIEIRTRLDGSVCEVLDEGRIR